MMQLHVSNLTMSLADQELSSIARIPAMQRRRLSSLAKLALNNAIHVLDLGKADYIVWVSQCGDEAKTLTILQDVLNDQTPSPTQFSTSVHNAISGLYSILCQDATPATSLAGSWNDGLIEAYAWLKIAPNARQVLVVYYEEPLPDIYVEHQAFSAFSMAALVSLQPVNLIVNPNVLLEAEAHFKQALKFYDFWQNTDQSQYEAWTKC